MSRKGVNKKGKARRSNRQTNMTDYKDPHVIYMDQKLKSLVVAINIPSSKGISSQTNECKPMLNLFYGIISVRLTRLINNPTTYEIHQS